jgi:hypothetical protein
MTCTISTELEQQLAAEAAHRQTTVDRIVEEAVKEYLAKNTDSPELSGDERLAAFRELQRSLGLTKESAEAWIRTIHEGRR